MYNFITKLEKKFEDLKDRYSKEQISLIFAKFEAEKIHEEVEYAISILPSLQEAELSQNLHSLYAQICEFKELVEDMIELQQGKTL